MSPHPVQRSKCPNCGFTGPRAAECGRCGVVYAKHRAPGTGAESAGSGPAQTQSARTSFSLAPWLILLVLGAVVVLGLKTLQRDEHKTIPEEPTPTAKPIELESPENRKPAAQSADRSAEPPTLEIVEYPEYESTAESEPRFKSYTYTWYTGADGYLRGCEEAEKEGKAVVVYFYTDWCPYCRELEKDLLTRVKVEEYLKYLVKIRINPEKGPGERSLADFYGVSGYPALFVQSTPAASPARIRRTRNQRLKTPEEFVDTLQSTLGESAEAG